MTVPSFQSPPLPTSGVRSLAGLRSVVVLLVIAGLLTAFVIQFDHHEQQWLVDGFWVLAIVLWVFLVRSWGSGTFVGVRVRGADLRPILAFLLVFSAAWLPFHHDWRWAYTGDSFSLYGCNYFLAKNGLTQNILSVHGIDNSFTYLWQLTYTWWAVLFGPSFLVHRFGMMVVACAALATIYMYYRMIVGRGWAMAIVAATATNYVWLWFSYVSYFKQDSFVFYYLTLIWVTLIWRHPERLGLWMLCGLTVGLAVFYTPASWSGVAFCALAIGVYSLVTRRWLAAVVLGMSFLLVVTPILTEIPWFLTMTSSQTGPAPKLDYILMIFRNLLWSPYDSGIDRLGVQGAFLRQPFGSLYLVGFAIALLCLLPPLRRLLRAPAAMPFLVALFLWDIILFSMTNRGYGNFSHKRSYNLLPLQIYFSMLPLFLLYQWTASWQLLRRAVVAVTLGALLVYAYINLSIIIDPPARMYGGNGFDGLIELRQRFPDRKVTLIASRDGIVEPLTTNERLLHVAYGVLDNLTIHREFKDEFVEEACAKRSLVCHEIAADHEAMKPLIERYGLREFPLLNTFELGCYECPGSVASVP